MGYRLADEVALNAPKATPPRDLLGLLAIARRINDSTRTGWLTREEIAHWARVDVRSVKALRERLVAAGLLVVVRVGNGRRRATEFYIPPMPGYLPGAPARHLDDQEGGSQDFPLSDLELSTGDRKGGSSDFPLSPVDNFQDHEKGGSLDFPLSQTERGKSGPERGKFGGKRGKSGLPPNPHSNPHTQSSSSSDTANEEDHPPNSDHPNDEEQITKEDDHPTASRAARVITKRIGIPLDEAERTARLIARENRIRKPLHIYVASIPPEDLRAWAETSQAQATPRHAATAHSTRPAGRCPTHYQDLPCLGCAADAKARKDDT